MYRCRLLAACAALLVTVITTPARAHPVRDVSTGPSTSTPPYVIPVADGVHIKTLLTVDDDGAASDGYELTGTPDGLGVTKTDRNHFSVFMNHEYNALTGTERRHGQKGAYVSTFRVDRRDFEVVEGEDTIDPGVRYWDYVSRRYQATASVGGANPRSPGDTFPAQGDALSRFCSATLSAPRQFDSRTSRRGYWGQIYFANEENGDEGRVFGVLPERDHPAAPAARARLVGEHQAGLHAVRHDGHGRYRGRRQRASSGFTRVSSAAAATRSSAPA